MYRSLAGDGIVRRLIGAAGAAPSIHNTQPWQFRAMGDVIEVHGDPDRMLWVAPPGSCPLAACGSRLRKPPAARRLRRGPETTGPHGPACWEQTADPKRIL